MLRAPQNIPLRNTSAVLFVKPKWLGILAGPVQSCSEAASYLVRVRRQQSARSAPVRPAARPDWGAPPPAARRLIDVCRRAAALHHSIWPSAPAAASVVTDWSADRPGPSAHRLITGPSVVHCEHSAERGRYVLASSADAGHPITHQRFMLAALCGRHLDLGTIGFVRNG